MIKLNRWKRVLSIILILNIIVSSNGVVTYAQISNEKAGSYINPRMNNVNRPEDEIQLLAYENTDFVIDVNNVLVKYNGSESIVTVPEGVLSIGSNAFDRGINGNGITEIYLPDSVTSLQDYAFSGCHTITELSIPENVASIGMGVFYFSKGLANILVGEENANFRSVEGVLFNKDMTKLVCYPQARTQLSFEIPSTVKIISDFAFDNAVGLAEIILPEGITEIGKMAFRDCTFNQIQLPESLISIGELAFGRCKNLKSIIIPNGVQTWGRGAFFYCLALEQVTLDYGVTSIGNGAFSSCAMLNKASIPNTVTAISEDAFSGCPVLVIYGKADSYAQSYATAKNITFSEEADPVFAVTGASIVVADTEVEVGDTIQLTVVVYPEGALDKSVAWASSNPTVATVDNNGFVECFEVGVVTITVTTNDGMLTDDIVITVSAQQVNNSDFTIVNGLLTKYNGSGGDIVIPTNVTRIDKNVFYGLSNITSVVIPDSVTSISEYAFKNCVMLSDISFSKNLSYIGAYAFAGTKWMNDQTDEFIIVGDGVLIGYKGSSTTVSIPNTVKMIGEFAFYNYGKIISLTIPDSVIVIGTSAFSSAFESSYNSLDNKILVFGQNVRTIHDYAFSGINYNEIVITDNVEVIGQNAFSDGCVRKITLGKNVREFKIIESYHGNEYLEELVVEEGNLYYSSENGVLFNKDKTKLIKSPEQSQLRQYVVPNTVEEICENAFKDSSLNNITLSDNTLVIGKRAFTNSDLTELTIPQKVTRIDDQAFQFCKSMNTLTIEEGVSEIGDYAFGGCSNLTSITIPGSVEIIGVGAFSSCDNLASVIIDEGITSISAFMFNNCRKLAAIVLPVSLKSIKEHSFEYCGFTGKLTIPDSVETVEPYSFANCTGLKDITVANTTNFSYETFNGCNITDLTISCGAPSGVDNLAYRLGIQGTLKYLTISSGITKVEGFRNCPKLEKVVMPSSLTEIGSWTFENCPLLSDVELPENLEIINERAFCNDPSLTELEFPIKLKSIGNGSFKECINLKKVVIPSAQTIIDYYSFLDCINMEEVTVQNGLYNDTFSQISSVKTLRILPSDQYPEVQRITLNKAETIIFEDGIVSIGDIALSDITYYLPKSVISIGHNGFTQITKPMYVYKDSYAHKYAITNHIPYSLIDNMQDAVTGVSIIEESKVILLGTENLLVHAVTPATAGNKNVTWISSNSEIATVGKFGHVKGLKEGTVTITVTTEEGGFTDSCEVTIYDAEEEEDYAGKYEEDLTYMALSAMAYYDFTQYDEGRLCAEIIADHPKGDDNDTSRFNELFIKDTTKGEFISDVVGDWKFLKAYSKNSTILESGYYGVAFINPETKEIVIAARGTENLRDYLEDFIFGGLGANGLQFKDSDEFYQIIKAYSHSSITATGHSLGGALATNLAQKYNLKARVFNAPSATYAAFIWEYMSNFRGMDAWDIIDYTNEYCVIGNCGIGDNVTYAAVQFADYFVRYALSGKTVYDFMQEGNVIAEGGAIDQTIICRDNSDANNIAHNSWNTHEMGALVKVSYINDRPYYTIDSKHNANQKIPYVSNGTALMDNLYFELFLGSTGFDSLFTDNNIGINVMYGGDGNDIIITSLLPDLITGGRGEDYLNGGTSGDIYYFTKDSLDGDIINDPSGPDAIRLLDLQLDEIEIGTITTEGQSYFTITVKDSGNKLFINKLRYHAAQEFTIIDSRGHIRTLSENSSSSMLRSFSLVNPVTPIKIEGASTVEIYDNYGKLLKSFSNETTSQSYEEYGYFYGFSGADPYTMIYLFNGDYHISVKSTGLVDYYSYSLEEDDTPIMETVVSNVDLSGDKVLVTSTVPIGEIPQLAVQVGDQVPTLLVPEIKGINNNLFLNKNQLTLKKLQTEELLITGETSEKIIWSSSAPSVAEVDNNGKVTAKTVGNAMISATTEDGSSTARCFVTVWADPDPVLPDDVPQPGLPGNGVWLPEEKSITEEKDISDKKAADLVIALIETLGEAPTEIEVKAARNAYDGLSEDQKLLVPTEKLTLLTTAETYISDKLAAEKAILDKAAEEVKISNTKVIFFTGDTITIKITGTKSKVTWSSSKKSVATVSSKGKVIAKGEGSAIITATVGNKKYTCKVTVGKTIISPKILVMKIGDKKTIKIKGVTQKITWKSSDTAIAKVNKSGIVIAQGKGKVTITATVDKKRYSYTIKVDTGVKVINKDKLN